LTRLFAVATLAGLAFAEPRFVGPRRGEARLEAVRRHGGNAATERAVEAGLDWLRRHEREGGGWDADAFPERCSGAACDGKGRGQHGEEMPCPFDEAIGALAALAFLGRGEVPERALDRLAPGDDPWALALCTQAFAEAEALSGDGRYRDRAHEGARRLLAARGRDGGWGYAAGLRPGSDVPYTALVVFALLAARDAGFEPPADLAPRVDAFLASLEEEGGRLAYLADGRRYGYTPTTSNGHCAAAIRELLGVGLSSARHRAHLALVHGEKPSWKISFREVDVPGRGKTRVQVGNLSMYQWWYGTMATFQEGGGAFEAWFARTRTVLVENQRKEGCARGSWDPLGTYERQTGGRVFATALGVLMLEQPYVHARRAR
jgi:hypothetical protein